MRTEAKKIGKGYSMLVILLMVMLISPLQQLITNAKSGQISPPLSEAYWTDVTVVPSGSGTSEDPYIIDSAEKLAFLVGDDKWGFRRACFSQTKDIDLGGKKWKPIGDISDSANSIRYNGNGYKISNVTIVDGEDHRGLFGYVWNGRIENVNIVNPYIIGGTEVGGLAANLEQSWVQNCHVSGGYLEGGIVGGIAGNFAGYLGSFENVSSSAKVKASESAGGIIGNIWNQAGGSTTHLIKNAYFTGIAKSAREAGGIVGRISNGAVAGVDLRMDNCYSESSLKADLLCGGLVGMITEGAATVTIQNCGFNGDIEVVQANAIVGSMIGPVIGTTTTIKQSFGIAEVEGGGIILPFGADNVTWGDSYSYTRQSKEGQLTTYSKYKNIDGMKNFKYSPYINGGYPFPSGMFAVGGVLPEQDVIGYLKSYGFDKISHDIKTLANSTYGTDKYVEFGEYPQTYVGSSMNSTLESWYSGKSVVKRFTVDNGTSATSNANIYDAYTYTDGKTYVRVPSPNPQSSTRYKDGSMPTMQASWFKVEPIRWLILNYADVLNGADAVVIAEQGLIARTPWNKTQAEQNLWYKSSNIRNWLNKIFYNEAFGAKDKSNIITTTVLNNSPTSITDGTGESTNDDIWLLSYTEADTYFKTDAQRLASPTDFAIAHYCYVRTDTGYVTTERPNGGTSIMWLRTACAGSTRLVYVVNEYGKLDNYLVDDTVRPVRPALTLNI